MLSVHCCVFVNTLSSVCLNVMLVLDAENEIQEPGCRRETARWHCKFRSIQSVQAVVFLWYI